jgi:hypothetical protein
MLRRFILFFLILLLASAAFGPDAASSLPGAYGQQVSGSITDDAFFDHWQLNATAHDRVYVRMTGADGLRPLIGILSGGGNLLARSADGAPNDTVDLSFEVPETALYIIVATRVDNERGTTTGSYTLSVENTNPAPTRDPQYQDVTFACGTTEAAAAASIHFSRDDTDNGAYSIRVYGLDGFQPVIRVQSGSSDVCASEPADALGDTITLPGEPPITLAQPDLAYTTQYIINAANTPDPASITVTVGSLGGQAGRYLAVIGGFAIEPSSDFDTIEARLAPRPARGNAPLLLYVIGDGRLDPSVIAPDGRCDDAGRRGCESLPAVAGVGMVFNSGARVIGDRFDAGARLTDAAPNQLQIISFGSTTHGAYALLLVGALPAADS